MIFLTLSAYPDFITIFWCHDFFGIPPLMLILLFFYKDAIMTICKMRVKPFDVMIINRFSNMTSVDGATQLVDVC